jgi:hypothetical protein
MKIPLKNKKIARYLRRGVILTKDNLIKRNWHASKTCGFCLQDKTIKNMWFFFQCNFDHSIWSVIQAVLAVVCGVRLVARVVVCCPRNGRVP